MPWLTMDRWLNHNTSMVLPTILEWFFLYMVVMISFGGYILLLIDVHLITNNMQAAFYIMLELVLLWQLVKFYTSPHYLIW